MTGGLGFIGRHLVHALLELGKQVTILDRYSGISYNTTVPEGATLIQEDIRYAEQLVHVVQDIDLIFHIAANANGSLSIDNPRFDFETNVIGTFNMLEAASQMALKKFVYISSASVYGRPLYTPMDELHPTQPFVPSVTAETIQEFLATFGHLSVATRRRRYSALCAFYHWLIRHGIVQTNPKE